MSGKSKQTANLVFVLLNKSYPKQQGALSQTIKFVFSGQKKKEGKGGGFAAGALEWACDFCNQQQD